MIDGKRHATWTYIAQVPDEVTQHILRVHGAQFDDPRL